MYPGYGQYWKSIDANPERVLPFVYDPHKRLVAAHSTHRPQRRGDSELSRASRAWRISHAVRW